MINSKFYISTFRRLYSFRFEGICLYTSISRATLQNFPVTRRSPIVRVGTKNSRSTLPDIAAYLGKANAALNTVMESNDQIENLSAIVRSRNARTKHKLSLLEGAELINAAVKAGILIKHVYYSHPSCLDELLMSSLSAKNARVTFHHLHGDHYQQASKVGINSSLFGICCIPDQGTHLVTSNGTVDSEQRPISLVCDNIRDPVNMAVLITSAVATCCDQLLITKGCVDVWDPKVLKSAGVSLFRINHRTGLDWQSIKTALPVANCKVLLADSELQGARRHDKACPSLPCDDYDSLSYKTCDRIALVIGGETNGISRSAYEFCSSRNGNIIRIPMLTGIDSLNASVSASIILYEIHRQLASTV